MPASATTAHVPSERLLLTVSHLEKEFPVKTGFRKKGAVSAVDGVSFDLEAGTTLGVVGESGCGKSTMARLILGLIKPDAGYLAFDGHDNSFGNSRSCACAQDHRSEQHDSKESFHFGGHLLLLERNVVLLRCSNKI